MTYRDDRDADRARIAALEQELDQAKEKIDELEGRRSQALVLAGSRDLVPTGKPTSAAARWFGAPLRLELMKRFDAAYPTDKFEELIDTIREHTRDRGRTELLKTSVAWSSSSSEKRQCACARCRQDARRRASCVSQARHRSEAHAHA